MTPDLLKRSGRRAATLVAAIGVVAGALVSGAVADSAPAGPSAPAGTTTKDFTSVCTFPGVGQQEVATTISVGVPDSATTGSRNAIDLSITATLPANVVDALRTAQVDNFAGTGTADVDVTHNGTTMTLGVPGLAVDGQSLPPSGSMPLAVFGPMPSLTVYTPGDVVLRAGQKFTATVDSRRADGSPSPLGVFDVPCAVKVTTPPQDLTVTFTVTGNSAPQPGLGNQRPGGSLNKTLKYNCVFPQTGALDVTATLTGSVPSSGAHGTRLRPSLTVSLAIPTAFTNVLRSNGAATMSGGGRMDVFEVNHGEGTTLGVPGLVASATVPASGPVTVKLSPATPSLSVPTAGSVALAAGPELSGTFIPLQADGTPTALGAFEVPCTLKAGQNPALGTIFIT
ncbi:DUF6801 domain-containing protein [Actinocrispum wychmicini]|uniref:DUF6801 domain-containing protein n=1 Tax=Actinocrispum wychmicini TaxID=1213861 RepID=A0A4V2S421_9PSEU|nr:DUF6801 domain-containing protein [Actinocrispum wychmicini]TCO46510.1 hypothetical protein EV192_11989 [Actinocrispum wychmicini]